MLAAPAALAALPVAVLVAAAPQVLLRLQDPRITESSALVLSADGERLYTANDSGDTARVFAVDLEGRTRDVVELRGVEAVDVEDAALGPGGSLVVADVGDNDAVREQVQLLTLPDPARGEVDRRVLTYEDGPQDAEALLVHPRTGQTLVVSKGLFGSTAYEVPDRGRTMRRVGGFRPQQTGTPGGPEPVAAARLLVTGGAVSPGGDRLVLRTYTDAYVFAVPGDDLAAALRAVPEVVPLPATEQGEAVTWTRDGTALLTSSEGERAPVHRVPVGPAAAAAGPTPTSPATGPATATGLAERPLAVLVGGTGALLLAGLAVVVWLRRRE